MIKQPKLSSFYGPNAEVYSAQDYEALAARLAEAEGKAEAAHAGYIAAVAQSRWQARTNSELNSLGRRLEEAHQLLRDALICGCDERWAQRLKAHLSLEQP